MPQLELYLKDKEIPETSAWLNDGIILAAQSLLRDQTKTKIFGWQSTQCSKIDGLFNVVPPNSPFVQILHTGGCHWVATSNVDVREGGCYTDVIGIYDSGPSCYIHSEIIKSVCSFYKCPFDVLRLDIMNVVAQPNEDDCGVYAIAYATELAHRLTLYYVTGTLRTCGHISSDVWSLVY